MKLSVIIPDWKDPYLINTIDDLLTGSALGDQLEIIAIFDGHWPTFQLRGDPRVKYIHLGRNRGMRGAINAGVAIAQGEFIMRTDEHCMFAPGFDKAMTDVCQPNWIMTARRYYLDPVKWERMDIPPVDYEKLKIQNMSETVRKFSGVPWSRPDRDEFTVDETMAMQGSVWLMPRKWWQDVIGELQTEGYGPHQQDSHEMQFKTWKAGGKLVLNKGTWFAHKHRSFKRTHNNGTPENPANAEQSFKYALDVWEDYYTKEIRPKWNI